MGDNDKQSLPNKLFNYLYTPFEKFAVKTEKTCSPDGKSVVGSLFQNKSKHKPPKTECLPPPPIEKKCDRKNEESDKEKRRKLCLENENKLCCIKMQDPLRACCCKEDEKQTNPPEKSRRPKCSCDMCRKAAFHDFNRPPNLEDA